MARLVILVVLWTTFQLFGFVVQVSGQSTEFVYQGNLASGSVPANGMHDFEFALFDQVSGGTQLGQTISRSNVSVVNGHFSATLDFGNQFPGSDRFIEIRVRTSGTGSVSTLTPRQKILSAPFAIRSLTSGASSTFTGNVDGDVTGTQSNTRVTKIKGISIGAAVPTNGQVLVYNSGNASWSPATITAPSTSPLNYVSSARTTNFYVSLSELWKPVPFDLDVEINGWTHLSGDSAFVCAQSGLYLVTYYAVMVSGTGLRITKNNSPIVGSASYVEVYALSGGSSYLPVSKSVLVNLSTGDTLTLQARCWASGCVLFNRFSPDPEGSSANFVITRVP